MQGHLNKFQAKWESLSTSLMDSTGLKVLIDIGGAAISVLDKLTSAFGSVTMVALPFIASMSKMGNIGIFKTLEKFDPKTGEISKVLGWSGPDLRKKEKLQKLRDKTGLDLGFGNSKRIETEFANAVKQHALDQERKGLKAVAQANAEYNKVLQDYEKYQKGASSAKITDSELTLAKTKRDEAASSAAAKYGGEVAKQEKNYKYTAAEAEAYYNLREKQIKQDKTASKGLKGLSTKTKAMLGNIGMGLAIGAAVTGASILFQKADEAFTLTKQSKLDAMSKAIANFSDKTSEAQDNIRTIKSLSSEFATLAKGVNDSGENINLSAEQFSRYNEIVSQLAQISPELIQGYTAEGNAIVDRNTAISEGIKLQKEYAEEATRSYTNNKSMNDIIEGANVNISDARSDLSDAQSKVKNSLKDTSSTHKQTRRGHITTETYSDIISTVMKKEVDLERASVEELTEIANRRQQILDYAKQSGKYSEDELDDLSSNLDLLNDYSAEVMSASQPIYDVLLAWATQVSEDSGESLMTTIPESLQSAYQTGLREIAAGGFSAEESKAMARQLANDMNDLYENDTKGFRTALEDAEKAKKDFDKSAKDKSAVDAYNKSIQASVKSIEKLADAEEKAGNDELAKSLRAKASSMEDYAQTIIESLNNAFNPYQEAFSSTKNAKSTFDEWREGITDYADGIKSYKEVLDSVLSSEETGGNGSMAFWKAAEMTLGAKAVKALNYNVDAAKTKMTELQTAMTDGQSATEYFYTSLANNASKINEVLGKDNAVVEGLDGIEFNIDSSEWAAVADILGISEESMMSLLNAAQQFSNIDLSDTNAVKNALRERDTTLQKDGKMFALAEPIEKEAQQALGSAEAAHRRIQELNQDNELQLISLDVLKDNANYSKKYLESQTDTLAAYKKQAQEVAETFVGLGYGKAEDGIIKFNESDINGITASMLSMGASTDDLFATLKAFRDSPDIDISEKFKGMSDEDLQAEVSKIQKAYQDAISEDPTVKVTKSVDNLTSAINRLILAMGGIPDIEIDSNLDEIKNDIDELAFQETSSDDVEKIQKKIDAEKDYYEQARKNAKELGNDTAVEQIDKQIQQLEKYEKLLNEASKANEYQKELKKAEKWADEGLISEESLNKIKNGTLGSVFGNIDMDKRAVITWSKELKKTYSDQLKSWNYTPETGGIDTVFGAWDYFNVGDQQIPVSYSPILSIDGKSELLGKQTVLNYIQSIMDLASADGEWSLDEILKLDAQGLEVDKINSAGEVVGKQFVKGLIAGAGDDAEELSFLMHFAGDYGAIELALDDEKAQAKLDEFKQELDVVNNREVVAKCMAVVEDESSFESFLSEIDGLSDKEKKIAIKAVTSASEGDLESFVNQIDKLPENVRTQILAYIKNPGEVENLTSELDNLDKKDIAVSAGVDYHVNSQEEAADSTAGVNYGVFLGQLPPLSKDANVNYKLGSQESPVDKIANVIYRIGGTIGGTIKEAAGKIFGGGSAEGTSNRRKQSSFPSMAEGGRIGPTGKGGLTLTGELGTELVWLPDKSRSFLVGQYGPEMINLPSNAVVYPADETRRIIGDTLPHNRLRFGSMASGSYKRGSSSSYSSSSGSSYSSGGSSSSSGSNSSSSSESEYEKKKKELDHRLKMEYISESTYYTKLKQLYNQYQSDLAKNVDDQRAALEDLHDAWIDAYEAAKDSLSHQLEMGVITEAQYYDKLKSLGDQYYKGRSEYAKEWDKHLEELNDASRDAYDAQADELQRQLDKGLITIEAYYKKISELQSKWLTGSGLKKDLKESQDDLLNSLVDSWEQRMDDLSDMIDNYDLVDKNFEELKRLYEGLGLNIDDVVSWDEGSDLLDMWEKFIDAFDSPDVLNMFSKLEGGTKEYYKLLQEFRKEQLNAEKDYYDEITDLIQDTLKWEAEEKIKALEEQIDAFQEIIDKKKKSLSLSEQEISYMDEMTDYADKISKLQNEISILSRDTSRAGISKRQEKEAELADLLKEQNKTVRENTLDKTEDMLDDQADKFSEALQKEIDSINDWLDNTSEVLNSVKDAIENRETNNILERMERYNAIQGDGLFATVKDATDTLNKLLKKYGDNEEALSRITAILSQESNDSKYSTGIQPKTHHSGLAAGFTGTGASLKQNEVYRLLTDDELVLNRQDQFRIANQLVIGDSIQKAYSNLLKSVSLPSATTSASINLTVNTPITISGNADQGTVKELDKFGERIGDDVFDRLTDALRMNGISTGAKLNVRKK